MRSTIMFSNYSATLPAISAKTAGIVSKILPKNTEKSFGTEYETDVSAKRKVGKHTDKQLLKHIKNGIEH
jgi:hypothetical protein